MAFIYNDLTLLRDLLFNSFKLTKETDISTFNNNLMLLSDMSTSALLSINKIKNEITNNDNAIRLLDKTARNIQMMDRMYFTRLRDTKPDEHIISRFKLVIGKWLGYYYERIKTLTNIFKIDPKVDRVNPKVCLCCIAKNENRYIKDYIEYYRNLGFCHVHIIDNNDPDGERFEDVISDYIESGYVSVRNARGLKRHQCVAYRLFYDEHHKKYDYIAFFDCDEYLVLNQDKTIQEYLGRSIFDDAQVIQISWMMFGDNGNIRYEDKPMYERFKTPRVLDTKKHKKEHIKSIVRCDLEPGLVYFHNPHTIAPVELYVVNNEGERVFNTYQQEMSYGLAQLNHYYTKSLEEWLWRYKRGRADIIDPRTFDDFVKNYFDINERTIEKEKFVEEFRKSLEK